MPRAVVIGHDGSGNALGRALVIAELLEPAADVRVVAFGDHLWPPASGRAIELLPRPRTNAGLPAAVTALRDATRGADLLVAAKPRALSYGLASLVRGKRPLVLDIDDLEHAFVRHRLGLIRQLVTPDHELVTRLLERWRRPVRAVTVASRALQARYGGTWLPHVRERRGYAELATAGRAEARARLGLANAFVVGFVGTVRPHKGLMTAAAAVGSMPEPARLMVAGDIPDAEDAERLRVASKGRLVLAGGFALEALPSTLGACDVVVVPQDKGGPAVFQSPAKLLDAMAAGRPIVASDVGDAREILDDAGLLVPPEDPAALGAALDRLRDPETAAELGRSAARRYRDTFGLDRWRAIMSEVVTEALAA